MTYSNFLRTMLTYQKISKDLSELHDIGIDFFEGKYKLSELTYNLFECSFESYYTKEGIDWIGWFIYESDWGTRDFSNNDIPTFRINNDGETEVIEPDGEVKWGATDADGKPIAYSFESLWELLEKDYKL